MTQPSASATHVPTAMGNEGGRRARSFRQIMGGTVRPSVYPFGKRALHPLDTKTAVAPFPYDPHLPGQLRPDQMPRFLGALTDPDKLPTLRVNLAELTAMQNRVDPDKAQAWASGDIKSDRLPVVAGFAGKKVIIDGHHRLAGAWLRGDDDADVRFKDLEPVSNVMKGAADWSITVPVTKVDDEIGVIYGWASVIEKDGHIVTDQQGDQIDEIDMLKAAHAFMTDSRAGGFMHMDGLRGGDVVESMFFSRDLQKALGIDLGKVGWMIGYKPNDPALLAAAKRGDFPMFSIGGKAFPVEVT
jgi:hypothetical protein